MPAAAVIPAPIAYTNFAAVKTLVVETIKTIVRIRKVVSWMSQRRFQGWASGVVSLLVFPHLP